MKGSDMIKYALVLLIVGILIVSSGCFAQPQPALYTRAEVKTADEAKKILVDGNQRFVSGKALADDISASKRDDLLKHGQHPFVTILTCSDSRVAPEILFDQGMGDIFVVRTAGNVVGPVDIASIEYGVEHLHTPLLVILGHSNCGAVKATVETLANSGEMEGNMGAILVKIRPSVERAIAAGATGEDIFSRSENENVKAVIAELEASSPVIKEMMEGGELTVLAAKYHLDSGEVEWFK